jgi:molecular chaperone HtpG
VIKKHLITKCLEMFAEIAEKKDDYQQFYEQFGACLKLGVLEDSTNRAKVAELLRYHTSNAGDERISIKEYVDRMKEGQNDIYYTTGESITSGPSSPFLDALRQKGQDVLYLVDPIDESSVRQLKEFDGKKFKSTSDGPPGFGSSSTLEQSIAEVDKEKEKETEAPTAKKVQEVSIGAQEELGQVSTIMPQERAASDAVLETQLRKQWRAFLLSLPCSQFRGVV